MMNPKEQRSSGYSKRDKELSAEWAILETPTVIRFYSKETSSCKNGIK